jgi:hypothetical protein
MSAQTIKRYISDEESFKDIVSDFGFLVTKIKESCFEYDLQIRNGYFNLYYKGNSIGRISYNRKQQKYEVSINKKFIDETIKERFSPVERNDDLLFSIDRKDLHPLFQTKNLKSMSYKVKSNHFQEEIIYEQMLMTDNVGRDDLLIIDRQVSDKASRTKMDLLALKKNTKGQYQFCVLEVKLGNNPELQGSLLHHDDGGKKGVNIQLKGYMERIEENFDDYKACYEKNLEQKERLGLIKRPDGIEIVPGVIGAVVVLGYSGIASRMIAQLKEVEPSIRVIQFSYRINTSDMEWN